MARPPLPPYAAWLRVYEPLGAFDEPERSHWAAYAADPARPGRVALLAAEQQAAHDAAALEQQQRQLAAQTDKVGGRGLALSTSTMDALGKLFSCGTRAPATMLACV